MGCGRSRHRSPSLHPDGSYRDRDRDSEKKDGGRRAAKKQKLQADKTAVKAVIKREAEGARPSPNKTTNGRTGSADTDVKTDSKGGVAGREGGAKRHWQLEEAVDTPPETVMAVFKSSGPASARASLTPHRASLTSHPATAGHGASVNSTSHGVNGALVNGATSLPHDVDIQNETADRTGRSNATAAANAKPVHITNSQLEFFKMLDERIEGGPDYNWVDE